MNTKVININNGALFDVYIGRPGPWGNPFTIGRDGDRETVIKKYENWLHERPEMVKAVKIHLKDKVLGCHCAPKSCHGEILAKIAND